MLALLSYFFIRNVARFSNQDFSGNYLPIVIRLVLWLSTDLISSIIFSSERQTGCAGGFNYFNTRQSRALKIQGHAGVRIVFIPTDFKVSALPTVDRFFYLSALHLAISC